MYWALGALFALFASFFFFDDATAAGITQAEAKNHFSPKVAGWVPQVNEAAQAHGIQPRVLLSIIAQESAGEDLGYHPDNVSYGLAGLTSMALDALGVNKDPHELGPQEQISRAAEYLALLKKQEGSLFEALKWYNSGKYGGGDYARQVLNRAGLTNKIPQDAGGAKAMSTAVEPAGEASAGGCGKYDFCGDGGEGDIALDSVGPSVAETQAASQSIGDLRFEGGADDGEREVEGGQGSSVDKIKVDEDGTESLVVQDAAPGLGGIV